MLLRKHLSTTKPAPIFEIPHTPSVPAEVRKLLRQGYSTVIRLPFRDAEARAKVTAAIATLDRHFLLFSQHLKRLRVTFGETDVTTHVDRSKPRSGRLQVTLSSEGDAASNQRWTKWFDEWESGEKDKRLSVAVCLPTDAEGKWRPLGGSEFPAAYVFFPTEETLGARAVIHAALALTQNRKHFRDDGQNEAVFSKLGRLVAQIIRDIPAEVTLKAFGDIEPSRATGIAQKVATTVLTVVKETAFVPTLGGDNVRPDEVTTWGGQFGTALRVDAPELKSYRLLHPSVKRCNDTLKRLGAAHFDLSTFFGALRFCRNSTFTECKDVVAIIVREALPAIERSGDLSGFDWFGAIPCWWTAGQLARRLDGTPFLFEQPREWPDFVPADALSDEMRAFLQEIDGALRKETDQTRNSFGDRRLRIWNDGVSYRFLRSKAAYFESALLPALETMDEEAWNAKGWSVLRWCRKWCEPTKFAATLPLPQLPDTELKDADRLRRRISRCLRVPTNQGWRRAEQCYADRTWGAPSSFRLYFGKIPNRYIVQPVSGWENADDTPDGLEAWKDLLRFSGVSWEPKLVQRIFLMARGSRGATSNNIYLVSIELGLISRSSIFRLVWQASAGRTR